MKRCPLRLALSLALLTGAVLVFAAACTNDDDERAAALIRGLLLAGQTGAAAEMETFVGKLPPDLPTEPPLYPDADIIVSSRQPATDPAAAPDAQEPSPQGMLYFIALDSTDPRADVAGFYERELDEEPWQLEDTASTKDQDVFYFSDAGDPDVGGVVAVAQGENDEHTSVFISMQDAGAEIEDEPAFEPPDSLALPKDFPEEFPDYAGETVTSTAFHRAPGAESFLVTFITTDEQDAVIDFYRDAFEELGWTVEDAPAEGLATGIDFNDEANDIQGSVSADRFGRDDDYTEVTIQLQANPARDTGDETATPEEGDTPESTDEPTDEATPEPTDDAPQPTSAGTATPG